MKTGKRFRRLFAAGLSALTVALVVALAYQAIDAAVSQRTTAENVLRDYATMAAEQFSQRFVQVTTYRVANPLLYTLYFSEAGNPEVSLVEPTEFPQHRPARAAPIPAEALELARYSFRLNLASGKLETAGDTVTAQLAGWLSDTIVYHSREIFEDDWQGATVFSSRAGIDDFLIYTVETAPDSTGRMVYGVGGKQSDLAPLFQQAAAYGSLLPATLTGGETEEEKFVGILVTGFHNDTLFASELLGRAASVPYPLAGSFDLPANAGGLRIRAALVPDAARQLIIGGLPATRVPLLVGLLLLTLGLVAAAMVMLNREYQLARLRADLVSSVSHELRTPLAQIRMFAETMLLGRVRTEDEAHRSLNVIDQEARRLTHLVENLLYFSRSEKGVAHIAPAPTPLEPLVQETTDGFSPLAKLKSVKIETVVEEPVVANIDRSAVQQMLLNLLDNATKYGPEGQTVTVGVRKQDDNAVIWVVDEGPGVNPADREHIWERFWRREEDRKAGITGTGIGLSVVRELALMHGGTTWVENVEHGAKFVISVPMSAGGDEIDRMAVPA